MTKMKKLSVASVIALAVIFLSTLAIPRMISSAAGGISDAPLINHSVDKVGAYVGDVLTYTTAIENPTSEFTYRDFVMKRTFTNDSATPDGEHDTSFVSGSIALNSSSLGDSGRFSSTSSSYTITVKDVHKILPGETVRMTSQSTLGLYGLIGGGVHYSNSVNYASFDFNASEQMNIVSPHASYLPGETFTVLLRIDNNMLDQITDWQISGSVPDELEIVSITGAGHSITGSNFTISGNFINGSDVHSVSTPTYVEFEMQLRVAAGASPKTVSFDTRFTASTAHRQYSGELDKIVSTDVVIGGTTPPPTKTPKPPSTATPRGTVTPAKPPSPTPSPTGTIEADRATPTIPVGALTPAVSDTPEVSVPPVNGSSKGASWALLNAILAGITLVSGIVGLFAFTKKRDQDNQMEKKKNRRTLKGLLLRIVALLLGIAAVEIFFLTENIYNPMVLTDIWTPLMAALAVLGILALVWLRKHNRNRDGESLAEGPK